MKERETGEGMIGRYGFDVLLSYWRDLIRIVLYGLQGQRQKVNDTYRIGSQMPRPGEVKWRLGGVLPDSELVPLKDKDDFHLNNWTFLDEPKEDPVAGLFSSRYVTRYASAGDCYAKTYAEQGQITSSTYTQRCAITRELLRDNIVLEIAKIMKASAASKQ